MKTAGQLKQFLEENGIENYYEINLTCSDEIVFTYDYYEEESGNQYYDQAIFKLNS